MPDFTEADLRQIERDRDLPPDEPYGDNGDEDDSEPVCPHTATRLVRVYQERREVCVACGETLQTVVLRHGAWFCPHGRFNASGCQECRRERSERYDQDVT